MGRIGQGSFGFVYKAYDPQLDQTVAVKVPRPGVLNTEETKKRFLVDARSAAELRTYDNFVCAHVFGYEKDVPFIVFDFVDGGTLAETDYGQSCQQTAEWIALIAEALAHAHEKGMIHRDVKSSNILVDQKGNPYLTDFGLAQRVDKQRSRQTSTSPNDGEGYLLADGAEATDDATLYFVRTSEIVGTP